MPYTPPPEHKLGDDFGPIDDPRSETELCISVADLYFALACGAVVGFVWGVAVFIVASLSAPH